MVSGSDPVVDTELYVRCLREFPGQLVVHRNGCLVKSRKFSVVSGFSDANTLGVYNHSVDAIVSSMLNRFFYVKRNGIMALPVEPRPRVFATPHYAMYRQAVMSHIPHHFPPLTRSECVSRFSGLKRTRYEQAAQSLSDESICERDAVLRLFCKFAKNVLGDPARIISPRSARWNLELARYLKHLERRMYKAINKAFESVTSATVAKGLDCDAKARVLREKWDSFEDPVAVGGDASKLDAHIRRDHLQYEHSFYTSTYPRERKLAWMLRTMRKHRCIATAPDGVVFVRCDGRRASGDVSTSLGNVLIMTSVLYGTKVQLEIRLEILDDGDDFVAIMERSSLQRFQQWIVPAFLDAGITCKLEDPVFVFEEIVFCQHSPVMIDGEWRMVRDVRAVLRKDLICLTATPTEQVYRRWLGAVAAAGLHLNDGVPVLQEFYLMVQRSGRPPTERFFKHVMRHTCFLRRAQGRVRGKQMITPESRVSFFLATGIPPDAQEEIECCFRHNHLGKFGMQPRELDSLGVDLGSQLRLTAIDLRK